MNQKRKKKVVGPIIKPVTACMRQRVYWLWGRFLFRGASDLYDRDLLCDGSGSHGRVKGNQKEFVPEDGQILKRQRSHLPQGRVSLIFLKTICGEKGDSDFFEIHATL